jgi:hypothetical protein
MDNSKVIRVFYGMTGMELLKYWKSIELDTKMTLVEWMKAEAEYIKEGVKE